MGVASSPLETCTDTRRRSCVRANVDSFIVLELDGRMLRVQTESLMKV